MSQLDPSFKTPCGKHQGSKYPNGRDQAAIFRIKKPEHNLKNQRIQIPGIGVVNEGKLIRTIAKDVRDSPLSGLCKSADASQVIKWE